MHLLDNNKKENLFEMKQNIILYENIYLKLIQYYIIIDYWALDMMWCQPENNNIDRGWAKINIGFLRSTSRHVQCLNS